MNAGYGDSVARSARYVNNAARAHTSTNEQLASLQCQAKSESDQQVQLPFQLGMKRPSKSRVAVEFAGKTAVPVYDGEYGRMMRAFLNRDDWQPFSLEQAEAEATTSGLEDPLFDYAAKGTKVELETVEAVEGCAAYKLKLTLKNQDVQHMWIDTQSFLDITVDGAPRCMDDRTRSVWVYQRDSRSVDELMVPFALETAVDGYPDTYKMVIEKVAVNPKLDDSGFVKPHA